MWNYMSQIGLKILKLQISSCMNGQDMSESLNTG